MSDEGHRERLPSFERIQENPAPGPEYSPVLQSYNYEMGDQAVAQLGYNHVLPASYVAYPIHGEQPEHLENIAEGQSTHTIGTDLNIWSHYNWNAPLTSQLVSPQTY